MIGFDLTHKRRIGRLNMYNIEYSATNNKLPNKEIECNFNKFFVFNKFSLLF